MVAGYGELEHRMGCCAHEKVGRKVWKEMVLVPKTKFKRKGGRKERREKERELYSLE